MYCFFLIIRQTSSIGFKSGEWGLKNIKFIFNIFAAFWTIFAVWILALSRTMFIVFFSLLAGSFIAGFSKFLLIFILFFSFDFGLVVGIFFVADSYDGF